MSTFYVRKTGNDANAGTSAGAAKLTIQAAVNLATTAGDIVYVGAGSYRETVTIAASGSVGSVISLIGDYSGAQTGDAGVVRITGSNDDLTATRANCITATTKSWVTIAGLMMDTTTAGTVQLLTGCTNVIIDGCHITGMGNSTEGVKITGAAQSAITIRNSYIETSRGAVGVYWTHSATVDNCGHVVQSCNVGMGAVGVGLYTERVGGITITNSLVHGTNDGILVGIAVTVGQTVTVNNCLLWNLGTALGGTTSGQIIENYNRLWNNGTARTNTATGANSVSAPALFDGRWFFAAARASGTLVTPWSLASYSLIPESNAGSGAPTTDWRGASVTGSFREWGWEEYNSTLGTTGGAALGLPIVGSAIVRGAE